MVNKIDYVNYKFCDDLCKAERKSSYTNGILLKGYSLWIRYLKGKKCLPSRNAL